MIEIPYGQLSEDALYGVVDQFILREGTDYGSRESALEDKRQQVINQLKDGRAVIFYDSDTQSINLHLSSGLP